MADPVGTASAVIGLLQAAASLLAHVSYLHSNPSQKRRLKQQTQDLIKLLEDSREALPNTRAIVEKLRDIIGKDLQSVADAVQSVATRPCFLQRLCATIDHGELQEAERKLGEVKQQVVALCAGLAGSAPLVANDNPDLPSSEGGLDRCQPIFDFLQKTEPQQFRVICIHGMPGIGKTTLLNHVWAQRSSTAPFTARAYVQIGHDASPEMIRTAQESLVAQIGNSKKEIPSLEMGRGELKACLQGPSEGRANPLLLAIDNVFKEDDLVKLLPRNLDPPTSSCIIMTCRDYRVVRKLLNILSLQENDELQVLIYKPPCLNEETSRRVFADCAGFQQCDIDEYQDLLKALVPTCGGVPLALTVLGSIFKDKERRKKKEWEAVQKQMDCLHEDNEDTAPITKALQLSYSLLPPSRQDAFLDMVSCFYGSRWETAEDIVGEDVMRSLKASSLIYYEVDDIYKCNIGALRMGWEVMFMELECGHVAMHDLTLRFGEGILRAQQRIYPSSHDDQADLPHHTHFLKQNWNRVRNLHVRSPAHREELVVDLIKGAGFKRTLVIMPKFKSDGLFPIDMRLRATLRARASDSDPKEDHLRFVQLRDCDSTIVHAILQPQHQYIRYLYLRWCRDLSDIDALSNLQSMKHLHVWACDNFRGFSSVANWESLRVLWLACCDKLEDLPDDLGLLPKLREIEVYQCDCLSRFPKLRNPEGLSQLKIGGCKHLRQMPALETDVKSIQIFEMPMVECLWLDSCVSLTRLSVWSCEELREIHGPSCGALKELYVAGCRELMELQLPPSFPLDDMKVRDCPNLTVLPDGLAYDRIRNKLRVRGTSSSAI